MKILRVSIYFFFQFSVSLYQSYWIQESPKNCCNLSRLAILLKLWLSSDQIGCTCGDVKETNNTTDFAQVRSYFDICGF